MNRVKPIDHEGVRNALLEFADGCINSFMEENFLSFKNQIERIQYFVPVDSKLETNFYYLTITDSFIERQRAVFGNIEEAVKYAVFVYLKDSGEHTTRTRIILNRLDKLGELRSGEIKKIVL